MSGCYRAGTDDTPGGHLPAPSFNLEAARLLIRRLNQSHEAQTKSMQFTLLNRASIVIPNQHLLVNIVRLRVRQLMRGHRPLILAPPGMGFADVALSEVIAGKMNYEAAPGIKPDNSFVPIVAFPRSPIEKKAA
jgi:DNA-directed RNA polymerase subunit omega